MKMKYTEAEAKKNITNKRAASKIARNQMAWIMNDECIYSRKRERGFLITFNVDIFPSTSCKECYQTGCVYGRTSHKVVFCRVLLARTLN